MMRFIKNSEERDFAQSMFGNILESVIDYVVGAFPPEDIYPEQELKNWANAQYPEDVFEGIKLEQWAQENDYVKKEETDV